MATIIYVVDPDYSGPPTGFATKAEADRYLATHPRAGVVPADRVAASHRRAVEADLAARSASR